MIRIDNENIDTILNILVGVDLDHTEKYNIKVVLFGNTMEPKGVLKSVDALMGNSSTSYIHIKDKGTGNNSNDIHAIYRGDPYKKTILWYRGNYFWGAYGELVENNIGSY